MRIRAEKDFYAGLLYLLLAAGFLWLGRDYKMGAASRMGPGFFPIVLGWALGTFGVASILRSFFTDGSPIGKIAWKSLAWVTAGVLAFGMLITSAGLTVALPALVLLASLASADTRYDFKGLLILLGLTVFCVLVFVKGLGVPMPILGTWFDGIVPPAWQR